MIFILPTDTCYGIGCLFDDIESYKKIYEIKKRPLSKPFSVVVNNFDDISKYAFITEKQVIFLKKYIYPFTILLKKKNNILLYGLPNIDFYEKIAFRVAHNEVLLDYTKDKPIFLTSANLSGDSELYSIDECKKEFFEYKDLIIFNEKISQIEKKPPSNIFEFEGDTENLNFFRLNY